MLPSSDSCLDVLSASHLDMLYTPEEESLDVTAATSNNDAQIRTTRTRMDEYKGEHGMCASDDDR